MLKNEESLKKLMAEQNIDFDQVAALLYSQLLSNAFLGTLSFDQWTEIFDQTDPGSELKGPALERMFGLVENLDQCIKVYTRASPESKLKKDTVEKMKLLIRRKLSKS